MSSPRSRARWILLSLGTSILLVVLIAWLAFTFIRPAVDPEETWPLIRMILPGLWVVLAYSVFEALRPYTNPRL